MDSSMSDRIPLVQVRKLLHIGSPLPFQVLDSEERLLLNEGQVIHDEAQFEALVTRGAWANRAQVEAIRKANSAPATAPVQVRLSLFDHWDRLLWQFDRVTRALTKREQPDSTVLTFFKSLESLIERDPDIALFLCTRQEDRRFALYPLRHSIHCGVLAFLVAKHLGWDGPRCTSLGCAALTMNIGMLDLQAQMAEQDTPPTKKQLEQIRAHPAAGVSLLRSTGVTDEAWLETIGDHHEHAGGGGYPRGITEVSHAAHVLHNVDVYMAKISPRANRPPIVPQTAVRQMFQEHPSDPLAMAIIKVLGVHPPGSLVKLRSGEIAVSVRRPSTGTKPVVATLSDSHGKPSAETHRRDTADTHYEVEGPVADSKVFSRIMPERVYGLVEL
jgi:HD-GYP domain-containing protein (c-di-GMP phosphodiesterase class II)